jgi:phage/plasmid-like protein (TIGR03299 family)
MHNINTYIGRQSAWHNLGTVTGNYMSWAEILQHGGLDFEVVKNQLEYNGMPVAAWGIFRNDNGAFLGAVGEQYTPIQHQRGFEMIDALVRSKDGAHYETAGVLGEGEKVWGLADLKLAVTVGDDVQNGYLLFSTSHDGSMSHQYKTCLTRVVCQNTLNVALGEKTKSVFRIKHTRNNGDKIADAHQALAGISADVSSMEQKLNFLAGRKVTKEAMVSVLDRLFPAKKDDDGKPVDSTRRDNILTAILHNYESNDHNAFPEQRGTAYNLLNSITEHTDHERSTRGNGRAESALFGSGDALKSKAFEVLLETAAGLPERPTVTRMPVYSDIRPFAGGLLDSVLAGMTA